MSKLRLNEATIQDTVNKEAEATKANLERKLDNPIDADSGQIETALNEAFNSAKRQLRYDESDREWPAVLFIGEPGTGKTARANAWARRHGVNLYTVQASTMDDTDLNGPVVMDQDKDGKKFAVRLASIEFDKLNRPNSVLFLDEFNRGRNSVRGTLLTLINDHTVPDSRVEGGKRLLENFLFTIAAINPDDTSDDVNPLGQAEHDRFRHIRIVNDKMHWLGYMIARYDRILDDYQKEIEKLPTDLSPEELKERTESIHKDILETERRKALVTALVKDKRFFFDDSNDILKLKDPDNGNASWNGISLNNRTLSKLLETSDGTKEDFLRKWNEFCNNVRKPLITTILSDYKDVEDKANDALKSASPSSFFKKHEQTDFEKLSDYYNTL